MGKYVQLKNLYSEKHCHTDISRSCITLKIEQQDNINGFNVEAWKQNASIPLQFTKAAKVGNLRVTPVLREYRSHFVESIIPQLPASSFSDRLKKSTNNI